MASANLCLDTYGNSKDVKPGVFYCEKSGLF